MSYLRSLFVTLTIAVQLVTLAYVLVVMGNSEVVENLAYVNSTDARAVYFLAAAAGIMTLGLAVILWLERRGPSRRIRRRTDSGEGTAPVASGGTGGRRDGDRNDGDTKPDGDTGGGGNGAD